MSKQSYKGVWRKLNPRSKAWFALVESRDYVDQNGTRITPVAGDEVVITKKNGTKQLYTLVRKAKYGEYKEETMWSPAYRTESPSATSTGI